MKRLISLVLVLSMAVGLLTGCSQTQPVSKSQEGTVSIRFSSWDSSDNLDFQQEMVDKFNKDNPDIQVTLEGYGKQYDTKISAGMGANDAPDVMYMWNYPKYGPSLEPLDSYINKEGEDYKSDFYDALWNYNSVDGKILGIPVGYTTHVLYYNKDMFDKAKVAYPTDDWTWDELQDAAKKLTDKSKKVYGYAIPAMPDPYDYEMFLWSNGKSYVDKDNNLQGNINSDEAIEAFTMLQNMLKQGIAVTTEDDGEAAMKTSNAAMYLNGAWAMRALKNAKINFGVALLPQFTKDKKPVSIVSTSGVTISKDSKHKDAAWKFVKYWTSKELNNARIDYELPVLKSVVEDKKLSEDPLYSKFYTMLDQSSAYTTSSFKVKDWSDLSAKISLSFEQMLNPSTYRSPKNALNDIAK